MADGFLLVVAGAIRRNDGRWLMHRRPLAKHHGGLWEFPGGKVELSESPAFALRRELREELGIEIAMDASEPVAFAEERPEPGRAAIVILLYNISHWTGEPMALEGEEICWFAPAEIGELDMPPLDRELAAQLFRHEAAASG